MNRDFIVNEYVSTFLKNVILTHHHFNGKVKPLALEIDGSNQSIAWDENLSKCVQSAFAVIKAVSDRPHDHDVIKALFPFYPPALVAMAIEHAVDLPTTNKATINFLRDHGAYLNGLVPWEKAGGKVEFKCLSSGLDFTSVSADNELKSVVGYYVFCKQTNSESHLQQALIDIFVTMDGKTKFMFWESSIQPETLTMSAEELYESFLSNQSALSDVIKDNNKRKLAALNKLQEVQGETVNQEVSSLKMPPAPSIDVEIGETFSLF